MLESPPWGRSLSKGRRFGGVRVDRRGMERRRRPLCEDEAVAMD